MELQRTAKSQNNLTEQNSKSYISWLHSYSNQKVLLAWRHIQTNGIEWRAQKQNLAYMVRLFSTRVLRPFNGERVVFSKNSAEETGYTHAKEWNRTLYTIYKTEKL